MARLQDIQIAINFSNIQNSDPVAKQFGLIADRVSPEADRLIDEHRQKRMAKMNLRPARKNRGDTGIKLAEFTNTVVGEEFVRDLTARGYQLVDVKYSKVPMRDQQTGEQTGAFKGVIRFTFSCDEPEPAESVHVEKFLANMRETLTQKFVAYMRGKVWRNNHIWENIYNDTINLFGGFDPNCRRFWALRFDPNAVVDLVDEDDDESDVPRDIVRRDEPGVLIRGDYRNIRVELPR